MDESQNAPPRFTLPHDKVWLRPDRTYFEYRKQAHGIDHDEVEYNGKYKRIRELRDLAVLGLSFHAMQEHPCFVQMNILDDSPDAFLMTHVSEETSEIAPVEITYKFALRLAKHSRKDYKSFGDYKRLYKCRSEYYHSGKTNQFSGEDMRLLNQIVQEIVFDYFMNPDIFLPESLDKELLSGN